MTSDGTNGNRIQILHGYNHGLLKKKKKHYSKVFCPGDILTNVRFNFYVKDILS